MIGGGRHVQTRTQACVAFMEGVRRAAERPEIMRESVIDYGGANRWILGARSDFSTYSWRLLSWSLVQLKATIGSLIARWREI